VSVVSTLKANPALHGYSPYPKVTELRTALSRADLNNLNCAWKAEVDLPPNLVSFALGGGGPVLTRQVLLYTFDEAMRKRHKLVHLGLTHKSVAPRAKARIPTTELDRLLAEFKAAVGPQELEQAATALTGYAGLTVYMHRVLSLLREEPMLSPRQRWILMDILREARYSPAAELATDALRAAQIDEYLLGATVAVRYFKASEERQTELRTLLYKLAQELSEKDYRSVPLLHVLLSETLSSFSSFGRPKDIGWVLLFLDAEHSPLIKQHAMFALERILARSPEEVSANPFGKLCARCRELLETWGSEDVLCFPQVFALASQVVAVLSARLGDEIGIATKVICGRRLSGLAKDMLLYLSHAEHGFQLRALDHWLSHRRRALERARSDLHAVLSEGS
jgi:hypothetical protein